MEDANILLIIILFLALLVIAWCICYHCNCCGMCDKKKDTPLLTHIDYGV